MALKTHHPSGALDLDDFILLIKKKKHEFFIVNKSDGNFWEIYVEDLSESIITNFYESGINISIWNDDTGNFSDKKFLKFYFVNLSSYNVAYDEYIFHDFRKAREYLDSLKAEKTA